MTLSKKITIFEGPDGGGKSTVAQRYARESGARYVHFGPFPRVRKSLARLYVEGSLPALLGYQDVVLDRSWMSEAVYATAYREGADRLSDLDARMLDRLALRCGAVMVVCQPPYPTVKATYMGRKNIEMLENDGQLKQVYDLYSQPLSHLPRISYDYTNPTCTYERLVAGINDARSSCHPLRLSTAGNWLANVVVVGETFGHHKEHDPLYQWPFASFSDEGCSRWLTKQLSSAGVSERELLWVNADQDLRFLNEGVQPTIIALGNEAARKLSEAGVVGHVTVPHPQAWKRFRARERYPLLDLIGE